jgi:undecaprenyl-diphosphatase
MPQPAATPGVATTRPHAVHLDPPTSPVLLLGSPWMRLYAVVVAFTALAVAASTNGGSALLTIDEPIEQFVVDNRTSSLDTLFRTASFLGSTPVVLIGGALLAAVAWRRCHALAVLAVVATLTRPVLEFTLKRTIGRERPSLERMVTGEGHAFPSGHVMAGATLWLLIPMVVALYHPSRRLWWGVMSTSLVVVAMIGLSRIYLGVHWAFDVIGGVLAAAALLTALDAGFRWLHGRYACYKFADSVENR